MIIATATALVLCTTSEVAIMFRFQLWCKQLFWSNVCVYEFTSIDKNSEWVIDMIVG